MSLRERFGVPNSEGFKSRALNREDLARDLADYMVNYRRQKGTIPPSAGITRPINRSQIRTFDDVLGLSADLTSEMKQRRGGAALDSADMLPTDTYRQRRYDFIANEEGIRYRAYDDKTGLPVTSGPVKGLETVGVGFNMRRPDAEKVFKAATGRNDFEAVRSGKARLKPDEVQKLFEHTVREAEEFVQNKFKDVNLTEHQRIALVSLAFNNPALIGPNLTRYVREGNWAAARDEILYRSNAGKVRGLAARRYREAAMFVGHTEAAYALPDYTTYMRNYA